MLSEKEVKHIANLARFGLDNEELEKYRKDLSEILDYVAKLQEVGVGGVNPMSHSVLVENVTRKDEARPEDVGRINKIMEAVPQQEKGYVKVKAVL